MAGHSKWKQIKHKKAANDTQRGKVLTKHAKILSVVGRTDPNPDTNAGLRSAITNAKADGVPRDNIERVLKKLAGEGHQSVQYTECVYEGFGPAGVPFIILALTDNVNRTFPSLRTAFAKNGGNLGSTGSVNFMFNHVGVIQFEVRDLSEDLIFEKVSEAGGVDFEIESGVVEVVTTFAHLGAVREALEGQGLVITKSEPQYRIKDPVILEGEDLDRVERFIEIVEGVDDVDEVFVGF